MITRYNCVHGPVDMEENVNGYWVTYSDYELVSLDCNRKLERSWRAETDVQEGIKLKFIEKLEKQNDQIIYLSIAVFVLSAYALFKILS